MSNRLRGKVTERGQVTIPREIRRRLGIEPGEYLEFEEAGGGGILARKVTVRDPVDAAFGVLDLGRPTDELIERLRGPADAT